MIGAKLLSATSGGGISHISSYIDTLPTDDWTSATESFAFSETPEPGDLVVVFFSVATSPEDATPASISGYTEVTTLLSDDTRASRLTVAYKIMGDPVDTGITYQRSGSNLLFYGSVGAVQLWRGVDPTTPMDTTATTATGNNGIYTTVDPPAITPVTDGAAIVAGGSGAHAQNDQTFSSPDLSGFISGTGLDSVDSTIGLGYALDVSATYDPDAFLFSGGSNTADSWAAATLALRPIT